MEEKIAIYIRQKVNILIIDGFYKPEDLNNDERIWTGISVKKHKWLIIIKIILGGLGNIDEWAFLYTFTAC